MKKYRLFLLLGFAKPYTVVEYVAILFSYFTIAVFSSLLALYALYNALVIISPLPYLNARPFYYAGSLPLAKITADFYRLDEDLRFEVAKTFASVLSSYSWSLLATTSIIAIILLYPILSKIAKQTPFIVYRIGASPLRIYLYGLLLSYLYALPIPFSFLLSLFLISYWFALPFAALLSPFSTVSLVIAVFLTPFALSSIYLLTARIDVPLLVLVMLSGLQYVALSIGAAYMLVAISGYFLSIVIPLLLVARRRWAY